MLKIGIIGAGHLGKIHIKCIREISGYELIGFYDSNEPYAKELSKELNLKLYPSIDELIKDSDVIDIVTPTVSHFEIAVKALKNFKHVFIEKPLTQTVEEAKILMELKSEANVKVQVGHVERFNPAFRAALPFFDQPMFIESHRLSQFNPRGTDVSVVLDLMIHDLDIILSVVKSSIKRISASGVAVVSDSPDIANARIEFDNGCVANLTASRISMKSMRKSRFFQRDAYISVDFLAKESNIVRLKNVVGEPDPLGLIIDLGENKGSKQIFIESPEIKNINAIKEELSSFYNAIIHNLTPEVPIDDGFAALDAAHKIIDKLKINSGKMHA
ncbi:MAG: Gfo/Idh/MocA family oxidoreductase [Bacteroidetes bacterium]|nr:Gfo/Idh/MocA family oxidoreductase [Bacteroidota bacterium]HET6243025.1 Gfo/Idh/MocA family oxidoreductase [Bacteroidia bacterium]